MNLKKIGKVFTSKFVGTAPSLIKKNLTGRGLTKLRNTVIYHSCPILVDFIILIGVTGGDEYTQ